MRWQIVMARISPSLLISFQTFEKLFDDLWYQNPDLAGEVLCLFKMHL